MNRRTLLGTLAATAAATTTKYISAQSPKHPFADLHRPPTLVRVDNQPLKRTANTWSLNDIQVQHNPETGQITLSAPKTPIQRVHLRWLTRTPETLHFLGDAWERSYGDLAWKPMQPEFPLPWYFLSTDGTTTHAYGVRTGPASLAFWQVDPEGISLWLDVRNGGEGVELGSRIINLATIATRKGHPDETPFAAARAFCAQLTGNQKLKKLTVYGSNDWYYAYGKNSAEGILRDAALMAELAPTHGPRPYTVIDMGWEPRLYGGMDVLAQNIRKKGVLPGLWIRPLEAAKDTNPQLLLSNKRYGQRSERSSELAYDPTIPESRSQAIAKCSQAKAWGYDLIKHDFSTYDLLGQWGFEMGPNPTQPGWSFHDRSQTNAEIILSFYKDLRTAAGEDTVILGCNTIGHLSAGIFDLQRTGDDVSGRIWERTRRMGVNTLAFRLPQNETFFLNDADCVPFTSRIPWNLTERWLRAVAASGTALLISPEPGSMGAEQKRAVRDAFALVAAAKTQSEPQDWLTTPSPTRWKQPGSPETTFEWLTPEGASPFSI